MVLFILITLVKDVIITVTLHIQELRHRAVMTINMDVIFQLPVPQPVAGVAIILFKRSMENLMIVEITINVVFKVPTLAEYVYQIVYGILVLAVTTAKILVLRSAITKKIITPIQPVPTNIYNMNVRVLAPPPTTPMSVGTRVAIVAIILFNRCMEKYAIGPPIK